MAICIVIANSDETVQFPGLFFRKSKQWIMVSAPKIVLADTM